MLRYQADFKTLLWMALTTTLLVALWRAPAFSWWLYVPFLYFSIAAAIIAHNHNHVRTWKSGFLNHVTDVWITLFYGYPLFASIPYPAISAFYQQPAIGGYLTSLYSRNRRLFYAGVAQIVCLVAWVAIAFILDWRKALLYVVVPQQVSLTTVLVFNYIQHVHADEEDEWNHSRNITGPVLNFLMFNNGFHTVHHITPGLHWSLTPAEHRRLAHEIDPALNEPSLLWYLVRTDLLAPFVPALRRESMRLAREARG